MKVKLKGKKREFNPMELVITIETLVELRDMWHRFNLSPSKLRGIASNTHKYNGTATVDISLALDDAVEKY